MSGLKKMKRVNVIYYIYTGKPRSNPKVMAKFSWTEYSATSITKPYVDCRLEQSSTPLQGSLPLNR